MCIIHLGDRFEISFAADTLTDADADTLSYAVTVIRGRSQSLAVSGHHSPQSTTAASRHTSYTGGGQDAARQ